MGTSQPAGINCPAVLSLPGLSHGTHSVSVRSRDAAGNWSGSVTKNVAVDQAVSVTPSALPAVTSAASVPLAFTKDAGKLVACS